MRQNGVGATQVDGPSEQHGAQEPLSPRQQSSPPVQPPSVSHTLLTQLKPVQMSGGVPQSASPQHPLAGMQTPSQHFSEAVSQQSAPHANSVAAQQTPDV